MNTRKDYWNWLKQIWANPLDTTLRGIFADWLDDNSMSKAAHKQREIMSLINKAFVVYWRLDTNPFSEHKYKKICGCIDQPKKQRVRTFQIGIDGSMSFLPDGLNPNQQPMRIQILAGSFHKGPIDFYAYQRRSQTRRSQPTLMEHQRRLIEHAKRIGEPGMMRVSPETGKNESFLEKYGSDGKASFERVANSGNYAKLIEAFQALNRLPRSEGTMLIRPYAAEPDILKNGIYSEINEEELLKTLRNKEQTFHEANGKLEEYYNKDLGEPHETIQQSNSQRSSENIKDT